MDLRRSPRNHPGSKTYLLKKKGKVKKKHTTISSSPNLQPNTKLDAKLPEENKVNNIQKIISSSINPQPNTKLDDKLPEKDMVRNIQTSSSISTKLDDKFPKKLMTMKIEEALLKDMEELIDFWEKGGKLE
ncbi:hypothetical protein TCON_1722 [Astathelohania contejeani]|uniref:Uncharacterized protein n=1 Tax=Astathelohania contejeani TaxID=164912 RepID=A0ABQ7HY34_9MICR|nr:hypothetical protein TCON_1722 [Thelohania contejeani]